MAPRGGRRGSRPRPLLSRPVIGIYAARVDFIRPSDSSERLLWLANRFTTHRYAFVDACMSTHARWPSTVRSLSKSDAWLPPSVDLCENRIRRLRIVLTIRLFQGVFSIYCRFLQTVTATIRQVTHCCRALSIRESDSPIANSFDDSIVSGCFLDLLTIYSESNDYSNDYSRLIRAVSAHGFKSEHFQTFADGFARQ